MVGLQKKINIITQLFLESLQKRQLAIQPTDESIFLKYDFRSGQTEPGLKDITKLS
jgi:hypothetical protein